MTLQAPNPLSRTALSIPAPAAEVLSTGGRIAGIVIALLIAFDQSYDRTQVFAPFVALVALLTLLPLPGQAGGLQRWLGAGVIFFGGAMLASVDYGPLMLPLGALAAIGAAIIDRQAGRGSGNGILVFLATCVVLLGLIFGLLIQVVEG